MIKYLFLLLMLIPSLSVAKIGQDAIKATDTPSDEECLTYESTGDTFEYQNCTASDSIVSGDIVDGTISADDLGADSVSISEIATGGVATAEILDNTISSADIATTYCSSIVAVTSDPTIHDKAANVVYVNLVDSTQTLGSETGEDIFTVPVNMYAHSLRVTAAGSVGSGSTNSYTITLRDDAAATGLTCALTTTNTSCTDTTNIATLAAGSKLTVSVDTSAPAAGAADITEALVSLCLTQ